jgi:hypothetical protein
LHTRLTRPPKLCYNFGAIIVLKFIMI